MSVRFRSVNMLRQERQEPVPDAVPEEAARDGARPGSESRRPRRPSRSGSARAASGARTDRTRGPRPARRPRPPSPSRKPVRSAAPLPRFRSCITRRSMSPSLEARQEVARAVGRSVVDDDDLQSNGTSRTRRKRRLDRVDLVVDRNHHGDANGLPCQFLHGGLASPLSLWSMNRSSRVECARSAALARPSGRTGVIADAVAVEFTVQGRRVDAEHLGGSRLVAALGLKHPHDVGPLDDLHGRVGRGLLSADEPEPASRAPGPGALRGGSSVRRPPPPRARARSPAHARCPGQS